MKYKKDRKSELQSHIRNINCGLKTDIEVTGLKKDLIARLAAYDATSDIVTILVCDSKLFKISF